MWLALIVALVVAALALLPSALADGGPRLSARHHTVTFHREGVEGDYVWHWAVTICSSRAARIKLRHDKAYAYRPPESYVYASWHVNKKRAGCKRYRYSMSRNSPSVRSRVHVAWRGLRDTTRWVEATCASNCP